MCVGVAWWCLVCGSDGVCVCVGGGDGVWVLVCGW